MTRNLYCSVILLLWIPVISACAAKEQTVVGTWGFSQPLGFTAFEFSADGTLVVTQKTSVFDARETRGRWDLAGTTLTVTLGSNAPEKTQVVSLQPKLLRLRFPDGSERNFRKVSQMGKFGDISFE